MKELYRRAAPVIGLAVAMVACGAIDTTGDDRLHDASAPETRSCEPGATQACLCEADLAGAATCREDGAGFAPCRCVAADRISAPGESSALECDHIYVTVQAPGVAEDFPEAGVTRLTGFLYQADLFPPEGPPQGGWDVYEDPGLGPDGSVTIAVQGATLGKTRCLEGDHQILVLAWERAPDSDRTVASWQGYHDQPLWLGRGDVQTAVTLEPYACPLETVCM